MTTITVLGGTGTIGTQVVRLLRARGDDVRVASRASGVDLVTGQGLREAFDGAQVVVDTAKTGSLDPAGIDEFFARAGEHLTRYEREAGVQHHVMLSIVGSDRAPDVPFYAAKVRLEDAVRAGEVPCTILHATQFFEFAPTIARASAGPDGGPARLAPVLVQPVAGADVAAELARLVDGPSPMPDLDLAGPERFELDVFVRAALAHLGEAGAVVRDPDATYFGGIVDRGALLPGPEARIAPTALRDWTGAVGRTIGALHTSPADT
ncbi:SDR family oxidoreductase [Promicromonospora kroppenstedtii]|uniref:SDR family oxidoreductase n=1 Tax=Promicromonospora kroppenstedtii TaxID=440482 RepID=A0ABW7XHS9_9MICO